jgi:hypothetical protein
MAYIAKGKLMFMREPIPAKDFIDLGGLDPLRFVGEELQVVLHTRYSTSDIRWNQPLPHHQFAVVFNGVISQDTPDKWPYPNNEMGQHRYQTGNDAEIIQRYAATDTRYNLPGSYAILELWSNGRINAYRNEDRPLYRYNSSNGGTYYASTQDMLQRCGLEGSMIEPVNSEEHQFPDHYHSLKCLIE